MNPNRNIVDTTIKEYLKRKVKEEFADDYWLIEPEIDRLIENHNLKELMIIVRVEIDKIKNRRNMH